MLFYSIIFVTHFVVFLKNQFERYKIDFMMTFTAILKTKFNIWTALVCSCQVETEIKFTISTNLASALIPIVTTSL